MNPQDQEQFVQMLKVRLSSKQPPSMWALDLTRLFLRGAQMQIHHCEVQVKQKPRNDEAFSMWGFALLQLAVVEAEIKTKQVRACPCLRRSLSLDTSWSFARQQQQPERMEILTFPPSANDRRC